MKRDRRLQVVLSQSERVALQRLADRERLSAAAVIRRLIWREARRCDLLLPDDYQGPHPTQEDHNAQP
jgi:hypothetical protein